MDLGFLGESIVNQNDMGWDVKVILITGCVVGEIILTCIKSSHQMHIHFTQYISWVY